MSALNCDASSTRWNDIFHSTDVSDMVRVFNEKVLSLLDVHAPRRQVIVGKSLSSTQPWFTDEIKRAIVERNIAEFEYKHHRVTKSHYYRLRNSVTNLIKKVKYDYMQPKLHAGLGSKVLWRNLREIGAVSCSNVKPEFTADEFNAHLVKPGRLHNVDDRSAAVVSDQSRGASFSFSNVSSPDVARAINSIKSNSIGLDGVPLVFVKMILPFILPPLTHIVNFVFTSSSVPRIWKLSKVLPVHKKSRSRGLNDFRPICILPCLSNTLLKF